MVLNIPVRLAGLILLLTATIAAAQDPAKFDLSTNDGVNAAREAISGAKLDARSKNCVRRNLSLPGIIMVGTFRYDAGCRLRGAFVNANYVAVDDPLFSRKSLEALGWNAPTQQRENLARGWVAKGLLAFLSVVDDRTYGDLPDPPLAGPQTSTNALRAIEVILWVRLTTGRTPGTHYERRRYTFSKDGNLEGVVTLETYTEKRR